MSRSDFWKIVLISSLISSALVIFALRWPSPPTAGAETSPAWSAAVPASADVPLSEDERINIRVFDETRRGVVNIVSTSIEYNFFLRPQARQGVGSGFVVDKEGHIVTNFHVIEGAEGLDVTLYDESKYEAEVVGVDALNDLAVLRIEAPQEKLYPLTLGKSQDLVVGQKVLAIGNPFGLNSTLTTGVISSVGRRIETENTIIDEIIQTDAAINPGNSGGPLLNTSGQVVGVNTLIYSRSGDSAGISFAVPVDTVSRNLPDLIEKGEVQRPWLGVHGITLSPRLARDLDLPIEQGLLIERIEEGSSLEQAGLRGGDRRVTWRRRYRLIIGGDVLYSIDGTVIASEKLLNSALNDKRPGDRVTIVFYRDGQRLEKEIELVGRSSNRRRL
ncbi:MAG TPA: trypsin-like peptidase domain-containing protein [Acidobacteriota bacterium]|nr:trypsin-like peptidase domain-containing protein [Acidobacteriota bacterium]